MSGSWMMVLGAKGKLIYICAFLFMGIVLASVSVLASPPPSTSENASNTAEMRVSFINPAEPGEAFWDKVTDLMRQEAKARQINLQVHYANRNRLQVLALVKDIVQQVPKPDYLIFVFQAHLGEHLLSMTEAARVNSFSINTNIPSQEIAEIGFPREKFRYWLGHMFPDEQSAGFTLAQSLVEQARAKSGLTENQSLTMIAIAGGQDSAASIERLDGLQVFLSAQPNVKLAQTVIASWEKDKARAMTQVLLKRYPQASIIWAASDLMALGAIDAAEMQERIPGTTIFSGGFDGTREGLAALAQGRMQATMSGHSVEGARALTLLHGHFNGIDFADTLGTRIRTKLTLIDSSNVKAYLSDKSATDSTK